MKLWTFLFCVLFLGSVRAAFLPQTDDIPLMDGLVLKSTEDVSFDTPAGQILVLEATYRTTSDSIRSFYAKNLTALGWSWKKKDTYVRGADTLELSFPAKNTVRFDITLSSSTH